MAPQPIAPEITAESQSPPKQSAGFRMMPFLLAELGVLLLLVLVPELVTVPLRWLR